jgi:hypothetical protein
MRILRTTIVVVCIAACLSSIMFLIALGPYYYGTRPRKPQPESGRMFQQQVKGSDDYFANVYLTRNERLPYDYAIWIQSTSMLFAVIAFLLNARWKVNRNPRVNMPKKLDLHGTPKA